MAELDLFRVIDEEYLSLPTQPNPHPHQHKHMYSSHNEKQKDPITTSRAESYFHPSIVTNKLGVFTGSFRELPGIWKSLGVGFGIKDEKDLTSPPHSPWSKDRRVLFVNSIPSSSSSLSSISKPILEIAQSNLSWQAGSMRTFNINIREALHNFELSLNLVGSKLALKRGYSTCYEENTWTHPLATHLKKNGPGPVKIRRTEFWFTHDTTIDCHYVCYLIIDREVLRPLSNSAEDNEEEEVAGKQGEEEEEELTTAFVRVQHHYIRATPGFGVIKNEPELSESGSSWKKRFFSEQGAQQLKDWTTPLPRGKLTKRPPSVLDWGPILQQEEEKEKERTEELLENQKKKIEEIRERQRKKKQVTLERKKTEKKQEKSRKGKRNVKMEEH